MGLVRGWLYCFLWYSSILAGYAGLFCPLLPLLLISNSLYRCFTDVLFTFWQCYPTVLLEILCGCEIQVSGDAIPTGETSLLVMNHRTRTDWNFLWPTMYHCVSGRTWFKHPTKFVLKDIIRHIPGPGWIMQLACFVYIKRCWLADKAILKAAIDYFAGIKYKYSLILFPEGTDFTYTTKRNSDEFAKKNDRQVYDYVLHPRTTGFAFVVGHMLEQNVLDAVYDVTLVYPDVVPQNEMVLLRGDFPKQVKVHLARYPSAILPRSDEALKQFLEKRWSEKERTLSEYHATGTFLHGNILKTDRPGYLLFALIFWTVLPVLVLYVFLTSFWFRLIVLSQSLLIFLFNFVSEGFQTLEIALYNFKRRFCEMLMCK